MVNGTAHPQLAPHQLELAYAWVHPSHSLLPKNEVLLERLRLGYGLLDRATFRACIEQQTMQILAIANNCVALTAFGECEEGKALNILTLVGTLEGWEIGLPILEHAARELGVKTVISVCAVGWKRLAETNGYRVKQKLFVRKVL